MWLGTVDMTDLVYQVSQLHDIVPGRIYTGSLGDIFSGICLEFLNAYSSYTYMHNPDYVCMHCAGHIQFIMFINSRIIVAMINIYLTISFGIWIVQ